MASTGAKFPSSVQDISESPWSDNSWTGDGNIYADDGSTAYITASTYDNGDQSYVLKAYNFDFSDIPDGATILGVTCRVNTWYRSGAGSGALDLLQLLNTSRAKVGTNQCSTQVALTTNNATVITKGSSSDLWGNELSSAWVKNSNFGVAMGIKATANNADVDIDYVTLEIEYEVSGETVTGAGTSDSTSTFSGVGKRIRSAIGAVAVVAALSAAGTVIPYSEVVTGEGSISGYSFFVAHIEHNTWDVGADEYVAEGETVTGAGAIDASSAISGSGIRVQPGAGAIEATSSISGAITQETIADWGHFKKIVVQTGYLDDNLTDFPLYVPVVADADIGASCRADGHDIRFTASDGTTILPYERESFSVDSGEATGNFWVKTDLSTAGTIIRIYYGNPGANDGEDAESVWDDDFKAVYHMDDATTSAILDSTENNNDGTKDAANTPIETDGKIGKGQDFNSANNENIDVADSVPLDITAALTISLWVKPETNPAWATPVTKGVSTTWDSNNYVLGLASGRIAGRWNGKGSVLADAGDVLATGEWSHTAFVVEAGTTNALKLYKNGVLIKQANRSGDPTPNASVLRIGSDSGAAGGDHVNGIMDEVRISGAARSAAWIKFEYYNTSADDNELTWGETVSGAGEISSVSSVEGTPLRIRGLAGTIGADSSISGNAIISVVGAGVIAAESSISGDGIRVQPGAGTVTAESGVSGRGQVLAIGVGSIGSESSVTGTPQVIRGGVGTIGATSNLWGKCYELSAFMGQISMSSSFSASGTAQKVGRGTITATSTVTGLGTDYTVANKNVYVKIGGEWITVSPTQGVAADADGGTF